MGTRLREVETGLTPVGMKPSRAGTTASPRLRRVGTKLSPRGANLTRVEMPLASESLPKARGLHWKDGFRGRLNTAEGVAHVRLDATGGVRIRMKLRRSPDPEDALVLNAALPANLRVAGPAHRRHLVADIPCCT